MVNEKKQAYSFNQTNRKESGLGLGLLGGTNKMMRQWVIKKLLSIMGNTYVWLDRKLVHETGPVLGLEIDEDFEVMSRRELCTYIEAQFKVDDDHFWNLHSTQKIRFCCQIVRNNELGA